MRAHLARDALLARIRQTPARSSSYAPALLILREALNIYGKNNALCSSLKGPESFFFNNVADGEFVVGICFISRHPRKREVFNINQTSIKVLKAAVAGLRFKALCCVVCVFLLPTSSWVRAYCASLQFHLDLARNVL